MTKEQKKNFIDYLEKSVKKTERIKGEIKTLKQMSYLQFEKRLIKRAKLLLEKNPNQDFDIIAEKFLLQNPGIENLILSQCLTEAYEQINQSHLI
tara:strand:+ start:143 stop:427 length:285 start_codon:yes stop_codon:yes gene_type:complete